MVELSEQRRTLYAQFQPMFWRKAENSRAAQTPYFENQLARENVLTLVAEDQNTGAMAGFVMAALIPAPPVYDPDGLTCLLDDFCVAEAAEWRPVGEALLAAVGEQAQARGAVQFVVVCAHLDRPKREALRSLGFDLASEWYVREI